jgi:hypothetical protein
LKTSILIFLIAMNLLQSCDGVMHEYIATKGGIEHNVAAPLDSSSTFDIVIDAEMDYPVLHGGISMPYSDANAIQSVQMDLLDNDKVLTPTEEHFEVSWFNNFSELKSMNDLGDLVLRAKADTSLSDTDYPVTLKFVRSFKSSSLPDQLAVHLNIKSDVGVKDTTVLFTLSTSEDHRGFRFH